MHLLREIIKSVFYAYPLDDLLKLMLSQEKGIDKRFLDDISKIMSVREQGRNISAVKLAETMIDKEWMSFDDGQAGHGAFDRCLLLLNRWTDSVLTTEDGIATVSIEHLLKWRDTTILIGEELPTILYHAKHDRAERTNFCWPEVADTGHDMLREALKDGVCDIHSHLNATSNSFIFSWVCLMNQIVGREEDFQWLQNPMDNPVVLHSYEFSDLYQWCILAAKIRCCLYNAFVLGDMKEEDVFDAVFADKGGDWLGYYNDHVKGVQEEIDFLRHLTVTYHDSTRFIDYAVTLEPTDSQAVSPYVILYGERQIEYQIFRKYLKRQLKDKRIGRLVYLYERIKTEYRKELLYTNRKTGLQNFKNYNARRDAFSRQDECLTDAKARYGIQTSLEAPKSYFEGRTVVGDEERIAKLRYNRSVYTDNLLFKKEDNNRMSIVYHLLKEPKFGGCNRYRDKKRTEWKTEMSKAIWEVLKLNSIYTGIDFAGSELYTRPETVAHLVRYAKAWGIENITYHVGEDFFDLVDGLRAIDEAVTFFGLKEGNRLGHALALGTNAAEFYLRNRYELVIPRQYLLDNLVWLIKKYKGYGISGHGKEIKAIANRCADLFEKIGYPGTFDIGIYCESMKLRSDDVMEQDATGEDGWEGTPWKSTARLESGQEPTRAAAKLRDDYLFATEIYRKGNEPEHFVVSPEYVAIVQAVQKKFRKEIEGKRLTIESNPTSNLLIANLQGYEDHPAFTLRSPKPQMGRQFHLGIGTDDKGIVGTSLQNEYALLAAALRTGKMHQMEDNSIKAYLKGIAEVSMNKRFTKNGIKDIFAE